MHISIDAPWVDRSHADNTAFFFAECVGNSAESEFRGAVWGAPWAGSVTRTGIDGNNVAVSGASFRQELPDEIYLRNNIEVKHPNPVFAGDIGNSATH